jgi:antitoxin component of MazEF toxin-antitoxin module
MSYKTIYSEERKVVKIGNSEGITLPPDFVRVLKTLKSDKVRISRLDYFLIIQPVVFSHNDCYDLLQLIFSSIQAVKTLTDSSEINEHNKEEAKRVLTECYDKLTPLQYIFESDLEEGIQDEMENS